MSDDEDDYLSEKFLVDTATSSSSAATKTYTDRRKEAMRRGALKNKQDRTKSRHEREREAREDALGRSLFDRAHEEAEESGQQNKALAMMMKMGFKPGQALGKDGDGDDEGEGEAVEQGVNGAAGKQEAAGTSLIATPHEGEEEVEPVRAGIGARPVHDAAEAAVSTSSRTVPLPLDEWEGKKGIGLRKRAASPCAPERRAKMARMAEERTHASFRDRVRQEYEERRAAGRLCPAQRTCATLDEKAGVQFNVLWLNPESPETFPDGLLDVLDDPVLVASIQRQHAYHSMEGRVRAKMQADALRPLKSTLADPDDGDSTNKDKAELRRLPYAEEELQEALQFLRLEAQDRLTLVLDYLRRKYSYCFWCGTQYEDAEDMENNCPGEEDDAHD